MLNKKENLEDVFENEIKIGFFRCIAEDCPGSGLYVISDSKDNIRQCGGSS